MAIQPDIYKLVKEVLQVRPDTRDSDRALIWRVFEITCCYGKGEAIMGYADFMSMPKFESITRARRQVQQDYPELRASEFVSKQRAAKRKTKGHFVHIETVGIDRADANSTDVTAFVMIGEELRHLDNVPVGAPGENIVPTKSERLELRGAAAATANTKTLNGWAAKLLNRLKI